MRLCVVSILLQWISKISIFIILGILINMIFGDNILHYFVKRRENTIYLNSKYN